MQLAACAYSNTTAALGSAASRPPQPSDTIGVMWAKDPAGDAYREPGPGKVFGDVTLSLVQRWFPSARAIETREEADALKLSRKDKVPYLVVPRILQWGNYGTIASRFADRVVVELRLLEVSTDQLVKSIRYEGSNNSVTFGSSVPEALLDENFSDAVTSLLRTP